MIADLEAPDGGTIERNPRANLAYLPQNPEMDDKMTVLDYLFKENHQRCGFCMIMNKPH